MQIIDPTTFLKCQRSEVPFGTKWTVFILPANIADDVIVSVSQIQPKPGGGEMLDIIGTERPLLFDPRVFIQTGERRLNMLREIVEEIKAEGYLLDGSESDELSLDGSESSLFYDWSKHIPSEYELMLDKWANEKETEGKAECLRDMCSSDGSECDEMSLD